MSEPPALPDATAVAVMIRELVALELADPSTFAERLADNIMEPRTDERVAFLAAETAAFRSDDLAWKSLEAARYLQENAQTVLRRRRRGSQRQRATEGFLAKVNLERRRLQKIVDGIRAKDGILPTAPNPRQRALRQLATENLAGDVPQGRYRELVIEETEKDRDRKRNAKKTRQRAKKTQG